MHTIDLWPTLENTVQRHPTFIPPPQHLFSRGERLTSKRARTEELEYTEQVAPPASAKRLLTLGEMSRGPKGIEASQRTFPVPRKRARIRTFRQTLIRCRCFSTRQKAEPSLKIPRRRYCIPIKAASQWLTSEGKSTIPVSKNQKKKSVTPMIRKVNAGTGAQLSSELLRLTHACWWGSGGPAQLSYVVTKQIWIKTGRATVRTLSPTRC